MLGSFLALPAMAHDLWLEADDADWVLLQGHRHSGHAGADVLPYAPTHVRAARCHPGAGGVVLDAGAYPARLRGDCAFVRVAFSSGDWTKTAWETINRSRTGIDGVLRSWRSEEAVARLARWGEHARRPLGEGLEILPDEDPFLLKTGDKLRLRVFLQGEPRAGVPVAYGDSTRGTTAADGTISVRLRHAGVQLISASLETPLTDGLADVLVRSATLQFELAP